MALHCSVCGKPISHIEDDYMIATLKDEDVQCRPCFYKKVNPTSISIEDKIKEIDSLGEHFDILEDEKEELDLLCPMFA